MSAASAVLGRGAVALGGPPPRRRRRPLPAAAAATGSPGEGTPAPAPDQTQPQQGGKQQQQQQQQQGEFDIVTGGRLDEAQGAAWPRVLERRRREEASLLTTGFPVPAGYGAASRLPADGSGVLWRLRNPPREPDAGGGAARRRGAAGGEGEGEGEGEAGGAPRPPLVPVFRSSPYSAEVARQRRASATARILVLDEGCACRAPLAAAVLQTMLSKLPQPLDVEVHAASLGPPAPGGPDARVARVARDMHVPLPPRGPPPAEFDEMRDAPGADLVLVLDRYDAAEVVREVSVLERLHPGGAYLTRVRRLGEFARAAQLVLRDRCLLIPDEVPDPLYGATSAAEEEAALRRAVHAIALSCRGLVGYLLKLQARCGSGAAAVPLRVALAQSLQCPLVDPTSHHAQSALIHCQLAPARLASWQRRGGAAADGAPRARGASPSPPAVARAAHVSGWPRPVWVEGGGGGGGDGDEGGDAPRPLWTVREVGGQPVVVRRPRAQQPLPIRGYWADAANVQAELSKWMAAQGLAGRLPSQRELRASGANTLSARVDSHGGLARFAALMGLPLASGRAANGHWGDFERLAAELRRFVGERGGAAPGAEPRLEGSEQAPGSERGAAQQQQQPQQQQQEQQQQQQAWRGSGGGGPARSPRYASRSWSSGGGGAQPGPASALLLEGGASGPAAPPPAPLVFLPTQQELRSAGRADLIGGIRLHGGSLAVAARLGWAVRHGRLPSEGDVVAALLAFAEERRQEAVRRGVPPRGEGGAGAGEERGGGAGERAPAEEPPELLPMPSLRQLELHGRADLAGAVGRLGGVAAFAHLLRAEQERRRARRAKRGGQQDAARVPSGQPAKQPSQRGPPAASQIVGYAPGGRRLPAPTPPQPAVVRVGQAVVQLIEARGWERRVPTKLELLAAGRRDLQAAIARCGGSQKLAEHLGLPYAETRGRRRAGDAGDTQPPALRPAFLAARLRPPPGAVGEGESEGEGGAAAAPPLQRQQSQPRQPRGPASRLLERELVVEAYEDVTWV